MAKWATSPMAAAVARAISSAGSLPIESPMLMKVGKSTISTPAMPSIGARGLGSGGTGYWPVPTSETYT